MLAFLLPLASKIVRDAVAAIPDNEELGEKLVEICLLVLKKAVTLPKPIWMINYWKWMRKQTQHAKKRDKWGGASPPSL